MSIELPTTVVYAYPQGGSPFAFGMGPVVNPYVDEMLIAANMFQNASASLYNGQGIWNAFRGGNSLK